MASGRGRVRNRGFGLAASSLMINQFGVLGNGEKVSGNGGAINSKERTHSFQRKKTEEGEGRTAKGRERGREGQTRRTTKKEEICLARSAAERVSFGEAEELRVLKLKRGKKKERENWGGKKVKHQPLRKAKKYPSDTQRSRGS